MPRGKKLNLVINLGDTGFYVNDLGPEKSPRFELWDNNQSKSIMKSDYPYDFDEWMFENIWTNTKEGEENEPVAAPKRRRKSSKAGK